MDTSSPTLPVRRAQTSEYCFVGVLAACKKNRVTARSGRSMRHFERKDQNDGKQPKAPHRTPSLHAERLGDNARHARRSGRGGLFQRHSCVSPAGERLNGEIRAVPKLAPH